MSRRKFKKDDAYAVKERFKQIRTNIEFSQMDTRMQVISLTSTFPSEGKTVCAINLAKAYSCRYKRVLLIDCDLRKPRTHKYLRLSGNKGLTDLLNSYQPGQPVISCSQIQEYTDPENPSQTFSVLTCGTAVPNPLEVLSSQRFSQVIKAARKDFDIIIIDCPPISAVADPIPIASNSDGTLYVISEKDTDKHKAKMGIEEVRRAGANLFGLILTKTSEDRNDYYYSKYGYGYGYVLSPVREK